MKKQRILFLLIICFVFIITACGNSSKTEETSKDDEANSETERNNDSDKPKEEPSSQDSDTKNTDKSSTDNTLSKDIALEDKNDVKVKKGEEDKLTKSDPKSIENKDNEIANIDQAIEYLKEELVNEINLKDTIFEQSDEVLNPDDKREQYVITLVSKSMMEKGGSGTIGKYIVYEDGNFELVN